MDGHDGYLDALADAESGPHLNVVLLLCDDLSYGDIGCCGSKAVRTPNIDRMAQNGARFDNFYAASPLCAFFDAWYDDWKAGHYVSVRLFDDYVQLLLGLPAGTCAANGYCGASLISEGDGGLYPCVFFVLDEWRLGAMDDGRTSGEIASCERERRFLLESVEKPEECASGVSAMAAASGTGIMRTERTITITARHFESSLRIWKNGSSRSPRRNDRR